MSENQPQKPETPKMRQLLIETDGTFIVIKTNELAGDIETVAVLNTAIAMTAERAKQKTPLGLPMEKLKTKS